MASTKSNRKNKGRSHAGYKSKKNKSRSTRHHSTSHSRRNTGRRNRRNAGTLRRVGHRLDCHQRYLRDRGRVGLKAPHPNGARSKQRRCGRLRRQRGRGRHHVVCHRKGDAQQNRVCWRDRRHGRQIILRLINNYTPFGQYVSQLGMGDYQAQSFVTPQVLVDPYNSAQIRIPGAWLPPPPPPPPPTKSVSGASAAAGVAPAGAGMGDLYGGRSSLY